MTVKENQNLYTANIKNQNLLTFNMKETIKSGEIYNRIRNEIYFITNFSYKLKHKYMNFFEFASM